MYTPWICRVALVCATLFVLRAGADTIVYNGVTYDNVEIRETSTRLYFRLPDGTAASISKAEAAAQEAAVPDAEPMLDSTPDVVMPEEVVEPLLEAIPEEAPVDIAPDMEATPETAQEEVTTEEVTPISETPAEEAQVEEVTEAAEAPVEATPADEAAMDATPEVEAPAAETSAEAAPVDEAPVEEAPVEEAPVEEAPAEEAPTPAPMIEDVNTASAEGALMAGASRVVVSEPGPFDEAKEINALVIQVGEANTAFVSVDMAALDKRLLRTVSEKLTAVGSSINPDYLFLGATGVNTGQYAGVMEGIMKEVLFGDFDQAMLDTATEQVVQALTDAEANLGSATIKIADADVPDLHTARDDVGATTDSTLSVMLASSADGTPVAYLVNFAMLPPVVFGDEQVEDRGEVGDLARAIRETAGPDVPVLFFNGAGGDIARNEAPEVPDVPSRGFNVGKRAVETVANAEARGTVKMTTSSREALLPPTMLEAILPKKTWIREAAIDGARFFGLPQAVAGQVGLLLRVKAQNQESENVFLLSQADDYQGYAPSTGEFFLIGPYSQLAFHGPLIMKWYADNFLPTGEKDAWKAIPVLGEHATAFQMGLDKGKADAEKIAALWETTSTKMNGLVNMLSMVSKDLPEQYAILLARLDKETLPIIGKQVAGAFLRGELDGVTEEQRVVLMGVSEGSQVPFDAILIMYALANQDQLPEQVSGILTLLGITEGYNPLK